MNNQNSEKENPSPIYFSPTGGILPPIEEENMEKGSAIGKIGADEEYSKILVPLQSALMEYALTLPAGNIKDKTIKIIQKLSLPLQDKDGKLLNKYVALSNIISQKEKIQQCTGTMEYKEIEEDMVNHPKHYTTHPSGVECIEITRHYCFSIGNAIKYLWRAGLKQEQGMDDKEKEIQDLEKAIWYIKDRIKQLKGGISCT